MDPLIKSQLLYQLSYAPAFETKAEFPNPLLEWLSVSCQPMALAWHAAAAHHHIAQPGSDAQGSLQLAFRTMFPAQGIEQKIKNPHSSPRPMLNLCWLTVRLVCGPYCSVLFVKRN